MLYIHTSVLNKLSSLFPDSNMLACAIYNLFEVLKLHVTCSSHKLSIRSNAEKLQMPLGKDVGMCVHILSRFPAILSRNDQLQCVLWASQRCHQCNPRMSGLVLNKGGCVRPQAYGKTQQHAKPGFALQKKKLSNPATVQSGDNFATIYRYHEQPYLATVSKKHRMRHIDAPPKHERA